MQPDCEQLQIVPPLNQNLSDAPAPTSAFGNGDSFPFYPVRCAAPVCCILGASFWTPNLGVSALASSTVASILNAFPNARIFSLDYGRTPTTHQVKSGRGVVNITLVNLRFSWKIFLQNNIARLLLTALLLRLVPSKPLRARLISRNPYLNQIASADIIGSLAGGDSFSDIYGLRRFFYMALPQLLVLLLDKPLTLLPQTLGPFKGWVARAVGGYILRHAQQVFARDRESLTEVRPLMRNNFSNLAFAYDMAFLLEPIPPLKKPDWWTAVTQARPVVGLNISGLLYSGGYTKDNMFGLKLDYKELVRAIIAYFIEQAGAHVILVPHVFGGANDLESDPAAGSRVYRELADQYPGKLHLITEEYDEHEMKYLIGQCDFFLGSRMHACIAALSQGVPAVGLAYSKKFQGVLQTIGAESLVVDLRKCDLQTVVSFIGSTFALRMEKRASLVRKMSDVKQSVAELFAQIVSKKSRNSRAR